MSDAATPTGFDPSRPFALFENSRASRGDAASLLFWSPARSITARDESEVEGALRAIDGAGAARLFACGYVTYEAGYFLVDRRAFTFSQTVRRRLPLVHFQCFSRCERLDRDGVDRLLGAIGGDEPTAVHDLGLSEDLDSYRTNIERIRGYIRDGETYQVNYTFKARFSYAGTPASLYRALRDRQTVEYAAYLSFPEVRLLSLSPELFVRKRGASIASRPMKGTAPRGATPEQDAAIASQLRQDPKTRSENVMIVDLIRNDLARIARPGSVVARDLFEIQSFETLHQMVSTVEGRVPDDLPPSEALRHLFPCGSITGAPKIRTMEIIERLEGEPRGVYTGAIGYVLPDNDYCFNVAIRTVVSTSDGRAQMGLGSGILAEADARAEFDECRLKARFLTDVNASFRVVESMRFCPGAQLPERFDRHASRMLASARAFGFSFDRSLFERAVRDAIGGYAGPQDGKVRVLLSQDGRIDVGVAPIEALREAGPRPVAWSAERVDSGSVFRRHKTTARALYEREFERARAIGAYDVLFLNERGEIAEASRHNVFVEKNGRLLTPAVGSGALPGVYRAAVLADRTLQAHETVLRVEDVLTADRVLLSNSVRGMVEVVPLDPVTADLGRACGRDPR